MTRRALLAEGRARGRLDHSAQHISRMAKRRLLCVNAGDLEAILGVEFAVSRVKPPAAFGNHADAAPGAIGHFKNFTQQLLRRPIALKTHYALVGVFHFMLPCFELDNGAPDSVEQIERLKPGNDDWDFE